VLAVALARSGDVEIAQGDAAQAVGRAVPAQSAIERPLRFAVRVDRVEWGQLGDRTGDRYAVDRRRGAEHEALHPGPPGGLKQGHAANDVRPVADRWVTDGLADQRTGGAVQDRLDRVVDEQPGHLVLVRVG